MTVVADIKKIIDQIFQEEGIKKQFLDPSTVKNLIENYYLTPEFRDFDNFKNDEKGNVLPPGVGKEGWEKTRRKNWTGKNVSDSLTNSQKQEIEKLTEEMSIAYAANNDKLYIELLRKKWSLEGQKTFTNQLDRLVEISDTPELNGFFNKEEVSGEVKSFVIKYFFDRLQEDADLKRLLYFLTALFNGGPDEVVTQIQLNSTTFTNVAVYVPFITLDGLFINYFNNSTDSLNKFFKNIEVEKERKGMYNDIGYSVGAKNKKKKNHISIVNALPKSGGYYAIDNTINTYFFDKFQQILEKLEYPLIDADSETYYRKYFNNDFANNLASSLAKTYGDDEEIKDVYRNFLSSIGYDGEEIDRFLYLFVFPDLDFSECDPEPPVEPTTPVLCEDANYDIPPADWTTMAPNTIYFDENACCYKLSFTTDYTTTKDTTISKMQEEYLSRVTEEMLHLLGRSADKSELSSIEGKIKYEAYYINPKPLLNIKLLVSLSKKDAESIQETAPISDEAETAVYNIEKFFSDLSSLADVLKIYEQEMIVDLLRGNALHYENLNFSTEASYIEQFSANLSKLIGPLDAYEEITMGFENNVITSVTLSKEGYKSRKITQNFQAFASSPPQTRARTINFIQSAGTIISTLQSNPDFKYLEFVEKYFSPPPVKKLTQNRMFGPESNKNKFATAGELGKRAADFLASEIKDGFSKFSCITDEEAAKLDDETTGNFRARLERYRQFKSERYDINIDDIFLAEAPVIFQEIMAKNGEEALKSLGTDFLNRLGVCGIGDLVSLAANTLFSALNPQEYMDALVRCAISKLDPQTAERFHKRLATSQFFENAEAGTQFLQTYRNTVGDALLPWETTLEPTRSADLGANINLLELPGTEAESDFNLRMRMYGDSLSLSFDPQQILQLLNTIPGGEWIRFFIEISDSIIQSCKFIEGGDSLLSNKKLAVTAGSDDGRCFNKRPQWPAILDKDRRKNFFQKKKGFLEILGENAKSIIIEIAIKLLGLSFKQLFTTISATFAGDVQYFKQGNVIPDFFQDGAYFYNIVRESSENSYLSDEQIDNMVMDILAQTQDIGSSVSEESVSAFLSNTSYVVGEKQKLDLLKGESSISTKRDIIEANKLNSVGKLLQDDLSKIDDLFSALGKDVNIREEEDKLSEELSNDNVTTLFCLEENDNAFGFALRQNKGVSPEEAEQLTKEKQKMQEEQLCNFMDLVSNPVAPIFGKAFQKLLSKGGPIFGLMEKEKFNIFKESLKSELTLITNPTNNDLYDSKSGFLSLMLHGPEGFGYERRAIYGTDSPGSALQSALSSLQASTNFKYYPKVDEGTPTYSFKFKSLPEEITLWEYSSGLNDIKVGSKTISEYVIEKDLVSLSPLPAYIATTLPNYQYSSTASAMFKLLSDNINITKTGFNKNDAISSIIDDNFPWLVERYYGTTKREMIKSRAFTFEDWESLYTSFTSKKIEKLLDIDELVDSELLFYQQLDADPRLNEKRKNLIYESPFDQVLAKEDYVRISALSQLLIKTYTLEAIMKSFYVFRAFSEKFFNRQDILSKYIVKEMKADLGKDYALFVDRVLQVYLNKVELGIVSITNQEALPAYEELLTTLDNFRTQEREDNDAFIQENAENIEILISDFAESVVKETINDFRTAYSSFNVAVDQFTLGPLLKSGAIDVVANAAAAPNTAPQNYYFTPYYDKSSMSLKSYSPYDQTRIILEKYIHIDDKTNLPPSLASIIEGRGDELKGVVNLESWKSYLTKYEPLFQNYDISQLWDSWKFGIRLSYIMPQHISPDDVSLKERQETKAYCIEAASGTTANYTIVPLVSAEIGVKNQEIIPQIGEQFDLSCLIYELILTDEYKNLFTEALDIETLISLITIYNVDSFVTLLGDSTKTSSDLHKWYKNPQSFVNTKETLIKLLEDF